jgi:RimJ/RimL family protein N-acetyltransferase
MIIRRLDPVNDESLLRRAFEWDADAPRWYADSDAVCRPPLDVYLNMTRDENQVDIGVFDEGEMIGLVTFDHKVNGVAEVRFSAKRGAQIEMLTKAAYQLRHQFFSLGMNAGVVWIAKRNRQIVKLCEVIGFVRDGTMCRGVYHRPRGDRPIEWVRMITTREQWLSEQQIAA